MCAGIGLRFLFCRAGNLSYPQTNQTGYQTDRLHKNESCIGCMENFKRILRNVSMVEHTKKIVQVEHNGDTPFPTDTEKKSPRRIIET